MSEMFKNLIGWLPECVAALLRKTYIKIIKLPGTEAQPILVALLL